MWNVITDYRHHSEYVPYLTVSRVIKETPTTVYQEGTIRVLLWTFRIFVWQDVMVKDPMILTFESTRGSFKQLSGHWQARPLNGFSSLEGEFDFIPQKRVPAWAVKFVARHYLSTMVDALATRAETKHLNDKHSPLPRNAGEAG